MIAVAAASGFGDRVVTFYYDEDSLAIVRVSCVGRGRGVAVEAVRSDGSALWSGAFDASEQPDDLVVEGVAFASTSLNGVEFRFQELADA